MAFSKCVLMKYLRVKGTSNQQPSKLRCLLVVIMNILVGGLNVLGQKPQGRQVR